MADEVHYRFSQYRLDIPLRHMYMYIVHVFCHSFSCQQADLCSAPSVHIYTCMPEEGPFALRACTLYMYMHMHITCWMQVAMKSCGRICACTLYMYMHMHITCWMQVAMKSCGRIDLFQNVHVYTCTCTCVHAQCTVYMYTPGGHGSGGRALTAKV